MGKQWRLGIALGPYAPTPLTKALDEKDIIIIVMGSDTAAIGGVTDHDIINAPIGYKSERRNQFGDVGHVVVDSLYQQCPRASAEAREPIFGKWAVFHGPAAIALSARIPIFFPFARSKT